VTEPVLLLDSIGIGVAVEGIVKLAQLIQQFTRCYKLAIGVVNEVGVI
jgi:hypothetical protein